MDIQRAKEEIKRAVQAYLATDDIGRPLIPAVRQRPILLMGPPGVGKTQIMEQIAQECDIALVAYTITHHTRQSAVGLPFIRERNYGGRTRSVTEYTMSEIIASVYAAMERTGKKNGILFIAFDKGHRPLPFRLSIIAFAAFGLSCAEYDNYKIDLRLFCTVLAAVFLLIGVYTAVLCVRNAKSCAK